jgi:parallel beta-helix repeat protein
LRHFILKPLVVLIAIAVIATVALDLPHTSELNEVNSSRENANLRNGTTEIESKILSSEDTGPQIFEHHWSEKSEENIPTLPDSRNKDTSSGGFISPIIQQTSIASSSSGLTPREPILIDGNESFTAANGVTSGSGTENDPYIIENWDIRAENGSGIEIRNTTAHFIIRNCYVHDGWHGIWFYNVINGKIDNNLLENLYCGIALWYRFTNNNLVSNNVLKKTGEMGILSFLSENNTIENNLVENVVSTGLQSGAIYAVSGRNTVISKNIIRNSNSIGISLDSETLGFEIDNNLISNNIVENCAYGIKLWSSTLPWWKGPRKNKIDNNIVKGNVFGIYIEYSDKNLILNNTVENNQQGIYIKNSENNLASNNIVENGNYGIRIDNSFNSKIDNNLMKSCTYSIFIENSVNNTVENNVVENNSYGIHLYYSPKNSISHNTIRNNSNYAIYLDISSVLTIERNLIKNNYCGIYLWYSHFNTIRYNTVENNSHGIELRYYSANFIYHNNFTSNANQAYDDSATGYWDNGYPSGGNFWNDYTGEDNYHGKNQNILGSDGIGDTPYYIPGDNNRDRYPLMSPIAGAYTGEVLQGTTVVNGRAETDTEVVITSSQEEGFVTMVKYKGNPGGPPPDNLKVLGKFVEVRTDIPSENVVWPIEIRIYYTDNEVAEAGISENSLRIFYWNGCEWVQEENSGVDIENNYVWARVTHLSPFTPLEGIIRGVEVSISPSYQSGLPR